VSCCTPPVHWRNGLFPATSGVASAGTSTVGSTCPTGVEGDADEGGPAFVNEEKARVKKSATAISWLDGDTPDTISLTINPD
jgi:hypothetical protein